MNIKPAVIVNMLQRSNLPTILVEGKNDVLIYRILLHLIAIPNTTYRILGCGSRNTLLKVYEKKVHFADKQVVFLADKDMWVFEGVPEQYNGIGLTSGYSIENDLYDDCQTFLLNLLNFDEQQTFQVALNNVLEWFAFEVQCYLENKSPRYDISLLSPVYMGAGNQEMNPSFLQERQFKQASAKLRADLQQGYGLKLRGKFLFDLFEKTFQERAKKTKGHKIELVTHSKKQLWDLCCRIAFQDQASHVQKMARFIREGLSK